MSVSGPELVNAGGFTVVGLNVRTKNEHEFSPKNAKISKLWEDFLKVDVPHRKPNSLYYGVYSEYESDFNGLYTASAAVEVDSYEGLGEQFNSTEIKKGEYLLFKNSGPIPQTIKETWEFVWEYFKAHPEVVRTYETDFEMCDGVDGCEVYIGVEPF